MANNRPQGQPFQIFDMTPEVRESYVYPHLLPTIMSVFARTCRQAEEETRLLRLLQYAINALPVSYTQQDKSTLAALEMLKSYPRLLFLERDVKDLTGQWHYGSAYKMFLRTGNIAALNEVHAKIIPQILGGEALAKEHYEQQFPRHAEAERKVYDDRNIAQIAQVKEDLIEIAAAISEDRCPGCYATKQRTKDAIGRLKAHLAPKEGDVIRTGLLSPPEILKIIHDVYDQNFDPWSGDQLTLYSYEVIGAAEAVAAPHHAQRYKKGLGNADENTAPDRTVSYYLPGGAGVPSDLGTASFVDVYCGERGASRAWGRVWPRRLAVAVRAAAFWSLCRATESALGTIHAALDKPSPKR